LLESEPLAKAPLVLASPVTNPVVAEKPSPSRTKSTLNLQDILSNKGVSTEIKEKLKSEDTKANKRQLKLAEVQEVWKQFAETRKGQVAEYSLLQRDFELVDNTIHLQLTNPVEEPLLAGIKTDLLDFLKEKLDNDVCIEGVMLKHSSKKIIYTNKEKFDHLAEKNPMLLELKERLGLDMDY
jgi:hypothetical protein